MTESKAAPAAAPAPGPAAAASTAEVALGLATGFLLLLPLRAMLETTTYAAFYGWLAATVALGVLLAAAARIFIRNAPAIVAWTVGWYAIVAPAFLWAVSLFADPGGNTEVAVLVGVPAAGLATFLSTVVMPQLDLRPLRSGLVLCVVGMVVASGLGEPAYRAVNDARDDARELAGLEASGLTPLLVEIDGLETSFDAVYRLASGAVTGYDLSLSPDRNDRDVSTLDVKVTTDPVSTSCYQLGEDCTDHGDYRVITQASGPMVEATYGSVVLTARAAENATDLPDPDEIGRALADAEIVEWSELLDLKR